MAAQSMEYWPRIREVSRTKQLIKIPRSAQVELQQPLLLGPLAEQDKEATMTSQPKDRGTARSPLREVIRPCRNFENGKPSTSWY
jgi:hypothetical protein